MATHEIGRLKILLLGTRTLTYQELTKVSEKIKLEKDHGFIKVMYIQRTESGGIIDQRDEIRYERPSNIIPTGAGCEHCDGLDDKGNVGVSGETIHHDYKCPFPKEEKLVSTIGFFKKEFINTDVDRSKTDPTLKELRKRWKSGKLTDEDIEDTLNDTVFLKNGKVKIPDKNALTSIRYRETKPLSGRDVIRPSGDWPSAVCLYYESAEGEKTQFRLDSKGNINILHIPWEKVKEGKITATVVNKIKKVIPDWDIKKGYLENPVIIDMVYKSSLITKGTIDIETLKKELFPRNNQYKYLSASHIDAQYPVKDKRAVLTLLGPNNFKIPLNGSPSFSIPGKISMNLVREGISYNTLIARNGAIKIIASSVSKEKRAVIKEETITKISNTIGSIIDKLIVQLNKSSPVPKTLTTISGKPLPKRKNSKHVPVCRGVQNDKPSPQPTPYSFKGKCPEPGQVIFPLEGIEGADELWYPCCGKLTKGGKKSETEYRKLLLNGFPKENSKGNVPSTNTKTDKFSGVLPKDFDKKGTKLKVKIPDNGPGYVEVKMKERLKNGKFKVTLSNSKDATIERNDIQPESRHVLGLKEIIKQRREGFIEKYGKTEGKEKFKEYVTAFYQSVGKLSPHTTTSQYNDILRSRPFHYLTYTTIQKLYEKKYRILSVPKNSSIVAITEDSGNEVVILDLEDGTSKEIVGAWKNFKGVLIGHKYTKNKINHFIPWKSISGSKGKPPSNWNIIDIETKLEDNIIDVCGKPGHLQNNTLVFFNGMDNKSIIWYDTPKPSKPHLIVQLVGNPIDKNKQNTTWNVGINNKKLKKNILGPRKDLTITVKNNLASQIQQIDPEDRYFWVKPQYNTNGKLDTRNPLSLSGSFSLHSSPIVVKKPPEQEFYNTIEQLINKIPGKTLEPVKYRGVMSWNIDSKRSIYENNKLKVETQ